MTFILLLLQVRRCSLLVCSRDGAQMITSHLKHGTDSPDNQSLTRQLYPSVLEQCSASGLAQTEFA